MISSNLYESSGARRVIAQKGRYSVLEYIKDISTSRESAEQAFFASEMNLRKRQLVVELTEGTGICVQGSSMQMMLGNISVKTDVKGAGDLVKKIFKSTVTGETVIKPLYCGRGQVVLEPTYKYILLEDLTEWKSGMVIEDRMFLACDETIDLRINARSTASSLILGNEGIFNTVLQGEGIAALESPVPLEEIVVVDLVDDVIRIDGNMALAWSGGLEFTVEKATPTLVGSLASGEGFVNVYRGTGRVMVAPVRLNRKIEKIEGIK